jgi:hypothetical protein
LHKSLYHCTPHPPSGDIFNYILSIRVAGESVPNHISTKLFTGGAWGIFDLVISPSLAQNIEKLQGGRCGRGNGSIFIISICWKNI